MTVERDSDPDVTWPGNAYPVKSPAELALEDEKPRARFQAFADRWGSPWLVFPVVIALIVSLWGILFKREKSCPKPKK